MQEREKGISGLQIAAEFRDKKLSDFRHFQLPALDGPVELMLAAEDVKGVEAEDLLSERIVHFIWISDPLAQFYCALQMVPNLQGGLLPDYSPLRFNIDKL